jgi:Ca2+-binding EF-hand superfamily protein
MEDKRVKDDTQELQKVVSNIRRSLMERNKNIRAQLKFYDTNRNGMLSLDEFRTVLEREKIYMTDKKTELLFKILDVNGNGIVT